MKPTSTTRAGLGIAGAAVPANLASFHDALLSAGSIAEIRAFAPLPDEAQRLIDDVTIEVGLERLTIVRDMIEAGMVHPLADPLSVLELYWEAESKVGGAMRTMHPGSKSENSLVDRTGFRIPIYATTEQFQLGLRLLRASRRAGTPLDTTQLRQALRRVNEAIEDSVINGATTFGGTAFTVNGNGAPGFLNFSAANTYAYSSNEAWDVAGHDGNDILADVLEMVEKLQNDKYYGPYNLYVPTSYGLKLMEDFKANSDLTIQQRLEQLQAGGRGLRIRVADMLPSNRTVLMEMSKNTADVIVGQEPTVLSWASGNEMERHFMAMAFIIPRLKQDYEGNCGIVVGNTT